MKNNEELDRKIQEILDSELRGESAPASKSEDERIYRLVYEGLGNSPEPNLSPDFAHKVINKLETKSSWKNDFGIFVLFTLLALVLIVGSFLFFQVELSLRTEIIPPGMFKTGLFIVLTVIFIQLADQKLLKSKLFNRLR